MKSLLLAASITLLLISCGKKDVDPNPVPPKVAHVQIGSVAVAGMAYVWEPKETLSNPNVANPVAFPKRTTTYKVTAENKCGKATDEVVVHVYRTGANGELEEVTQ